MQQGTIGRMGDAAIMLITLQTMDGDELIAPNSVISEEGLGRGWGHGSHAENVHVKESGGDGC